MSEFQEGGVTSAGISKEWPLYSSSNFSEHHLSQKAKKLRSSTIFFTSVNLVKMCFGLGFISVSKGISQAGIIGAVIGAIYVTYLNLFTSYLIIKARNRFKDDPLIVDICDLGVKLYGDWIRPIIILTLVGTNFSFLVAYTMFMGTASD